MLITSDRLLTTLEIPGHRIVRSLGLVHGICVRARFFAVDIWAEIRMFFGGKIAVYEALSAQARDEALKHLISQAEALGANAVIGIRYDASVMFSGSTEFFCYGTAVFIEEA